MAPSNTSPLLTLYTCVDGFAIPIGTGGWEAYPEGRQVFEGDAILRSHGAFFRPSAEVVEQATRAPGEIRPVRIPTLDVSKEETNA